MSRLRRNRQQRVPLPPLHLEGRLYRGKLCVGCTVTDRVAALLDNGTGHVDPDLSPLAAALATGPTPTPAGRLNWLSKPQPRPAPLPRRPTTTADPPRPHRSPGPDRDRYMRALLVACGTLPDLDRQLLDFEAWLARRLNGLAGHPHERLLRQFGLWHQLPRMRTKAALAPPSRSGTDNPCAASSTRP